MTVELAFDEEWVWVRRTKLTWEEARDLHERLGHTLHYYDLYMQDE